jgi:hypothetical protein
MHHFASVMLGYEADQSLENAMKVVALGFPSGVVFTCASCNRSEAADVKETARAMMTGWPRCHGKRMMVNGQEETKNAANLSSLVCG